MNVFDIIKKYYKLASMDNVKTCAIVPFQYSINTWQKIVLKLLIDIKYNNIILII
jgi:hypothetical protein